MLPLGGDGLQQAPGPGSPLGIAKLLIAGNDRIAVHGAPNGTYTKGTFESPERHTNLGCVSVPEMPALGAPLAP